MFARKTLRLASPKHAHASVGMPHDAGEVCPKELAFATEDGHTRGTTADVSAPSDQGIVAAVARKSEGRHNSFDGKALRATIRTTTTGEPIQAVAIMPRQRHAHGDAG